MTNRRARIAAGVTVLGLGVLGGVALDTNHGVPITTQRVVAGARSTPILTSASGAALIPANQPNAVGTSPSTGSPIVTRTSSTGTNRFSGFDD